MASTPDFDYARARHEQRDQLRAAILDAAAELLAAQGLANLSVRAIATRVGASTKVIYSHFGGKPGIIAALYRDGFERLAIAVQVASESDGSVTERLLNVAEAYRRFAIGSPVTYELMFGPRVRELLPQPAQRNPVLGASRIIHELVLQGQAEGSIRSLDAHAQTKFLWSALHATVSLELEHWFDEHEGAANHEALVRAALASLHP